MHEPDDHFLTPHRREAEILGARRLGGVSLYDMRYIPARQSDWHDHDAVILEMPLGGGYDEEYDDAHRHCAPGTLQLYAPRARHVSVGGPESTRIFHVLLPRDCTAPREIRPNALTVAMPFVAALYARFRDPLVRIDEPRLIADLQDVLARLAAAPSPTWLEGARQYVHAHAADSIGLGDVADELGVNPSHLGRTFRAQWGCSIGEYLRRIRVAHAVTRLIATSQPLLDIALDCGYADQSHFCREFGRLVGVSPGRFRRLVPAQSHPATKSA